MREPINASHITAQALKAQGVEKIFFIMAHPMMNVTRYAPDLGIQCIATRHEAAATYMAQAYSRLKQDIGVVATGTGAGTANVVTGMLNATEECCPVVVLGGSSDLGQMKAGPWGWSAGRGAFQEMDQVNTFKPVTKLSFQVTTANMIPQAIARAYRVALSGRPGGVYVDFPADVLHTHVDEQAAYFPPAQRPPRIYPDPAAISTAVAAIRQSRRPIVISGSGILFSQAWEELHQFVDTTSIPFFTTPQGRGVIPEDHRLCFLGARGKAFHEADLAIVVGTRNNYVMGMMLPPWFDKNVRVVQVNADVNELSHNKAAEVEILSDAKVALRMLTEEAKGHVDGGQFSEWTDSLRRAHEKATSRQEELYLNSEQKPISPWRLCKEVRDTIPRETVLVVDGQQTLTCGRQVIPSYYPGHRMNSGSTGNMGVGVPFGVGSKITRPDKPVVVLTGDTAFGWHGMELDTAVRYQAGVVVIVSNNAAVAGLRGKEAPGRHLLHSDYHKMCEGLGGWGVKVEDPSEIRPALQEALRVADAKHVPALVNVITDPYAWTEQRRFI